jgi:hypothetical protein
LASITALLNGTSAQASTNSPLGYICLSTFAPHTHQRTNAPPHTQHDAQLIGPVWPYIRSLGLGLILPPGVDDVVVIVNKDQPSSIIAYTLRYTPSPCQSSASLRRFAENT